MTITTTSTTTNQVVWYGSQQESLDLVNAVARNCSCEFGMMGVRLSICAPHRMLVEDQRALNGLLFVRRISERLRSEEWERPAIGGSTGPGEDGASRRPPSPRFGPTHSRAGSPESATSPRAAMRSSML